MKFVLLLLFSPFVACSFTSICPQQPNNVVVNCNNANPAYPLYPITNNPNPGTILGLGRGRVLDIGYNKPPIGSKLQLQRTDSSEEDSSESAESSEENNDHRIPLTIVHRPQMPSFYATTAVDHKLDFMRLGMAGGFRNNLKSLSRHHIPGHVTSTSDHLTSGSSGSGISEMKKTDQHIVIDETHGHGHSGQYNHAVEEGHKHDHEYGHPHHGPTHNHGHEHMHDFIINDPIPSHILIPTHITHPATTTTISGGHIIPQHVVPIGQIFTDATGDIILNQGHLNFDRGDPQDVRHPALQVSGIHPISGSVSGLDLHRDTHDRFVLTRRGYRALDANAPLTTRGTYELYPQDLVDRVFTTITVPRVVQDGMNTEINCEPIPIVSEIPQAVVTQGVAVEQTPSAASTLEVQGVNTQILSDVSSSTVITSDDVSGQIPQGHGELTVTKVTTTNVEERPVTTDIRIPVEETMSHGTAQGSTVTKVTTTKVSERPAVETMSHGTAQGSTVTKVTTTKVEERPVEETMSHGTAQGSTVTKVTTTKVEERPVEETMSHGTAEGSTVTKVTTTKVSERPAVETIIHGTPTQSSSTVTKVTTTKVDKAPEPIAVPMQTGSTITKVTTTEVHEQPTETIVHEAPVQTTSTVTKVTTTTMEKRPDLISETIVHGTPVETASTNTKATTTTKVEERPAIETFVHETPVRTGSIITTTTTTTENRPITSNVETLVSETSDVVSEIDGEKVTETLVASLPAVSEVVGDTGDVGTTPPLRLVRPIRDETYRYDSLRQRADPLVYRVY